MCKHIGLFFCAMCALSIFLFCDCVGQTDGVQDGVSRMATAIVRDLHNDGPNAWLQYFSRSQQFFMASNGQLVFRNYDSATVFVHEYAKKVRRVDLTWNNIRIDSLAPNLAVMAASFSEIQTFANGEQEAPAGYFTGIVEYTPSGWKLRNAHWSESCPQH